MGLTTVRSINKLDHLTFRCLSSVIIPLKNHLFLSVWQLKELKAQCMNNSSFRIEYKSVTCVVFCFDLVLIRFHGYSQSITAIIFRNL